MGVLALSRSFGNENMTARQRQKGTSVVIVAIVLPVLLAGLGLVIDNGQAFDMRRRLQKAADAGAIAASHELRRGNTHGFRKVVIENVTRNGFSTPETLVQIFNPPKTGKRAGDPDFVEVELRHEAPLYFMKAFYDSRVMVEARAIGGILPTQLCMLALNKTASPGLLVAGNAYVDVSKCGVQVDSSASQAARTNGGATMKAATIDVVGQYTGFGFSPTPRVEQPYIEDPLVSLPAPSIGKCLSAKGRKVKGMATLSPGTYCGGIDVGAGATATLNPGVYVLKGGGLTVHGGGTIKGDEVMFYNTTGSYAPINFGGGSLALLTAPTDGTYKGILFFTDRAVSGGKANLFTASALSRFTGTLYFPTTPLTFIGSTELLVQEMLIIADTIEFQGNCTVTTLTEGNSSAFTSDAVLVY